MAETKKREKDPVGLWLLKRIKAVSGAGGLLPIGKDILELVIEDHNEELVTAWQAEVEGFGVNANSHRSFFEAVAADLREQERVVRERIQA